MSSAQGGSSRDRVASQQMSMGGAPGGRRPAQKTFAGYSDNSELAVAGQRVATPATRKAKRSHPWLDYPPDFERKMAGAVVAVISVRGLLLSPVAARCGAVFALEEFWIRDEDVHAIF